MIRRLLLISAITALLVACGTNTPERPATKLTPEEVVAQRAKARWDAIIARDYRPAYDLLTPGTRATTAYEAYRQRLLGAALRWTSAEVRSIECNEPDVCRVEVYITYLLRGGQPGLGEVEGYNPIFEKWIRSDGQWYYLPDTTGR